MYVSDRGGSGGGGGGGSDSPALVDGLESSTSIVISWRLNSSAARLMDAITEPSFRAADGRFFGPTTMSTTANRTRSSAGPTASNPMKERKTGRDIRKARLHAAAPRAYFVSNSSNSARRFLDHTASPEPATAGFSSP